MLAKDFARKVGIKASDLVSHIIVKWECHESFERYLSEKHGGGEAISALNGHAKLMLYREKTKVAEIISSNLDQKPADLERMLVQHLEKLIIKMNKIHKQMTTMMEATPLDYQAIIELDIKRSIVNYMISDVNTLIPTDKDQDALNILKRTLQYSEDLDHLNRSILYRETLVRTRRDINNTERLIRILKDSGKSRESIKEQKSTYQASLNTYQYVVQNSYRQLYFLKDPIARVLEKLKANIAEHSKQYVEDRFNQENVTGEKKSRRG